MNVLIVGLGSIAKKHIDALYSLIQNVTIYAWRSGYGKDSTENVINIFHFDEIQEMTWDFALITNPTALHKQTIEQLLVLKCPLFIEKPLYHKLDIEPLVIEIIKLNILTYMGCNLRFLESIQFLKNSLDQSQRKINEINVYCGSYLPIWRKGMDFKKSYSSNSARGGGVHLDLIHELDYLYWLIGLPESKNVGLSNRSHLGINAPDYANYQLTYPGFCVNVILNYYRRDTKRYMEILFENGTWFVNLLENTIYENGKSVFKSDQTMLDTYQSQMVYFLDLINTNKTTSINTIKDGLNVLKLCLPNDTKK